MKRWYIIRSKYRNEGFLYQGLRNQGVETYYPCVPIQPVNLPTWKMKPYFPGYLFVHVDLEQVGQTGLAWIPGAIGLVCFGGEPAWVPDTILQEIRERVDHIQMTPGVSPQSLNAGDDIDIHSGLFAGYRGIFVSYLTGPDRVTVLLQYFRDFQIRVQLPIKQIALSKQPQS